MGGEGGGEQHQKLVHFSSRVMLPLGSGALVGGGEGVVGVGEGGGEWEWEGGGGERGVGLLPAIMLTLWPHCHPSVFQTRLTNSCQFCNFEQQVPGRENTLLQTNV